MEKPAPVAAVRQNRHPNDIAAIADRLSFRPMSPKTFVP
jgi:hypothetical protein